MQSRAVNQESIMQKLDAKKLDLVCGGGSSSPTPLFPSMPVPIWKPLFTVDP